MKEQFTLKKWLDQKFVSLNISKTKFMSLHLEHALAID